VCMSETTTSENVEGCVFPTGPGGQVCGRPVAKRGKPGRPSTYCEDDPEHTRAKAFLARRRFELAAARGEAAAGRQGGGSAVQVGVAVSERPVTDSRQSFGVLLARFEELAAAAQRAGAEQQAQLTAILERATEVVRTVVDPEAAGYEVEQIQREAAVQVAKAQTAQAAAEQVARTARRSAGHEAELRAQADEAAELALREAAAVRAEATGAIARVTADADTAATEHQQQIEALKAATAAEVASVRAEAAKQVTAAERAMSEASDHASVLIESAQRELAAAITAKIRAETDQTAAERQAAEHRAAVHRLQTELDQQRSDHREELAAVRKEAAEERTALRKEANNQLTAVLARFDQARHEAERSKASTTDPPKPQRGEITP
jgi:hypothetical protein